MLGGLGEDGGVGRMRRSALCARMRSLGGGREERRERLHREVRRGGRSLPCMSAFSSVYDAKVSEESR